MTSDQEMEQSILTTSEPAWDTLNIRHLLELHQRIIYLLSLNDLSKLLRCIARLYIANDILRATHIANFVHKTN